MVARFTNSFLCWECLVFSCIPRFNIWLISGYMRLFFRLQYHLVPSSISGKEYLTNWSWRNTYLACKAFYSEEANCDNRMEIIQVQYYKLSLSFISTATSALKVRCRCIQVQRVIKIDNSMKNTFFSRVIFRFSSPTVNKESQLRVNWQYQINIHLFHVLQNTNYSKVIWSKFVIVCCVAEIPVIALTRLIRCDNYAVYFNVPCVPFGDLLTNYTPCCALRVTSGR